MVRRPGRPRPGRTQALGVACRGLHDDGQATVPTTLTALQREVSAGGRHSCALDQVGAVTCWGADDHDRTAVPADLGLYTLSLRADPTGFDPGRPHSPPKA